MEMPESYQEDTKPQPTTDDEASKLQSTKARLFCSFCSMKIRILRMNPHILLNHAKERKVAAILEQNLPTVERDRLLTKFHLRGHRASVVRQRKRAQRKGNYCFCCDKSVSQDLQAHLLDSHSDRPEVVDMMLELDETKKHELFLKLQKRGARRCADRRRERRQARQAAALQDRCRRRPVQSKELRQTLRQMGRDEVALVVRRDPTILEYGGQLLKRGTGAEAVAERLGEAGVLLGCIRKHGGAPKLSLKAALAPENFPAVQAAIRDLAGYDGGHYGKPELLENLRATLRACATACQAACLLKINDLRKAVKFYDRYSEVAVISADIVADS